MARSLDEIVRDTLGNLQLQVIHLTAQLEAAQAKLPPEPQPAPPPPSDR